MRGDAIIKDITPHIEGKLFATINFRCCNEQGLEKLEELTPSRAYMRKMKDLETEGANIENIYNYPKYLTNLN